MVINAAGPFVDRVISQYRAHDEAAHVRLVKGSHIIVPRLHDGDWAYMFQQEDGRIIFAIPYEDAFTLIGTTEVSVGSPEEGTQISEAETAYLVAAAACIGLQGFYLSGVLHSWKRGVGFATMLTMLYGVLYVLLVSENNALLMGSLLLFGILAAIMWITRKVDWYELSNRAVSKQA